MFCCFGFDLCRGDLPLILFEERLLTYRPVLNYCICLTLSTRTVPSRDASHASNASNRVFFKLRTRATVLKFLIDIVQLESTRFFNCIANEICNDVKEEPCLRFVPFDFVHCARTLSVLTSNVRNHCLVWYFVCRFTIQTKVCWFIFCFLYRLWVWGVKNGDHRGLHNVDGRHRHRRRKGLQVL